MALRRFTVTAVVDDSGDAEVYSPVLSGRLHSIRYVKDDYEDGVDFAITSENTGATLWAEENVNGSATRYPRAPIVDAAGAEVPYIDDETPPDILAPIVLALDRVKIVVANGTAEAGGEAGTFHITIDG